MGSRLRQLRRAAAVAPTARAPRPFKLSAPWSFSEAPKPGEPTIENAPTPEGRTLEELTFKLGIAKGEVLIGVEPKQFYIRVAVDAQPAHRVAVGDEISRMSYGEFITARHITFRAVKHGWSSGNGDRFIWFNWELER